MERGYQQHPENSYYVLWKYVRNVVGATNVDGGRVIDDAMALLFEFLRRRAY